LLFTNSQEERNVNLEIRLKAPVVSACIAVAMAAAGCADMQNRPNTAAAGSTYVSEVRNTGSFGNLNAESRTRVGGERTWQGRKVFVYERPGNPQGDIVTELDSGRWIAFANGEVATLSWEPPFGWNFPLVVGETWTRKHRFTNHATKQTGEFVGTWKVDAYEDVTVRAGTFKAYKVLFTDTLGSENTTWFSPELGIFLKSVGLRSAKHPAGAGASNTELLSRPTMP
jgi:hypothetical protein